MRIADLSALALLAFSLAMISACPKMSDNPAVNRGKVAYMSTCIACHNMNPALDGAIGPAVKGASRALIEARVLRAEYPAGYKPKRDTHVMPAQPQMDKAIDDLAAYLAAP